MTNLHHLDSVRESMEDARQESNMHESTDMDYEEEQHSHAASGSASAAVEDVTLAFPIPSRTSYIFCCIFSR
jgi:hypothetical protein